MHLWGGSPRSEDLASSLLTIVTTSRWQGQSRAGLFDGSRRAKRRADAQKLETRLSRRVAQAPDGKDHGSARYSTSNGGVVTGQVRIRGDLRGERSLVARGVGLRAASKDSGLPPNPTVTRAACASVIWGTLEQQSAAVVGVLRAGTRTLRRTKGVGHGRAGWDSRLAWPVLTGKCASADAHRARLGTGLIGTACRRREPVVRRAAGDGEHRRGRGCCGARAGFPGLGTRALADEQSRTGGRNVLTERGTPGRATHSAWRSAPAGAPVRGEAGDATRARAG